MSVVGIIAIVSSIIFAAQCKSGSSSVVDNVAMVSNVVSSTPSPTPEAEEIEEPEIPVRPLKKSQKKELDQTLPPRVREVLEKADVLEIRGLSSEDKTGIDWNPDMYAKLGRGPERKRLLDAFYYDASGGNSNSGCFIPRHSLRATYSGKTIEVVICYQCHVFSVTGDLGEFDGGMYMNGSAAHRIFHKIMIEKGEPIK